ncbi:MAG TPA: hypothetical protein VGF32_22850 [Streptosporangiaceae bacterium]
MTVIEGNRILAARARDHAARAEPGTLARKAAGCACIALATTKTAAAARQVLDSWDGPADVKDRRGPAARRPRQPWGGDPPAH